VSRVRFGSLREVVERHLLAGPDRAGGVESQHRKALHVVAEMYRNRTHVGVTGVICEAAHVPTLRGVDAVDTARQVEHVRGTGRIMVPALRDRRRSHVFTFKRHKTHVYNISNPDTERE